MVVYPPLSDDIMVVYPPLSDAVAASTPAADSHLLPVLLCWVLCAWWEERRVREGRVRGKGEESDGGEGEGRVNRPIGEIFVSTPLALSGMYAEIFFRAGQKFFHPAL